MCHVCVFIRLCCRSAPRFRIETLEAKTHGGAGLKSWRSVQIWKSLGTYKNQYCLIHRCLYKLFFSWLYRYPGFITQYNGKPVLIRTTGTVTRWTLLYLQFIVYVQWNNPNCLYARDFRGDNYIEMDINVHNFGTLARKGMEIMFNNFSKMVIEVGFCVEGRLDSELPELLLGCVQMDRPNYERAVPWAGPI